LILRKIIRIVATRCHILNLNCAKFNFGWGFAPDPTGGAYSAPQTPVLYITGLTFKGRERRKDTREGQRKGRWEGI